MHGKVKQKQETVQKIFLLKTAGSVVTNIILQKFWKQRPEFLRYDVGMIIWRAQILQVCPGYP